MQFGRRRAARPLRQQDASQVPCAGGGVVGIRGIENQLDRRTVRLAGTGRPPVVVGGEDDHGPDFSRAQYFVRLVLADVPSESEIGIGRDALHLPAHRFGRMGRDDGEVDVVDLDRNGEAEQQQLHHGHQQHDEHRAPVAQDVQRLLSDEREESFHLIPSVWPCGPGCGTPRPSTLRHIVLSIRPEFPARGSARRP